ncbi:hypothetical protein CPB85DRAFT_1428899 [Mucidula mucida]|nr:hypothetical protein CPB85DRAFT_1428899 [Mucidula mucida]
MSPSPPENVAALPLTLGSGVLTLSNRMVMAAMTRNRAVPTTVPNEVMKAIPTSYQGTEWANAPCLHTEEHVAAWNTITDAVHEKGTPIFGQASISFASLLWHAGSVCHPDMPLQAGRPNLEPSAIGARDKEKFRLLPGYPAMAGVLWATPPRSTRHDVLESYRKYVTNFPFLLNVMMLPEESTQLINEGKIDGVEMGAPFIVNPDLVKRVLHGKELSVALDVKKL